MLSGYSTHHWRVTSKMWTILTYLLSHRVHHVPAQTSNSASIPSHTWPCDATHPLCMHYAYDSSCIAAELPTCLHSKNASGKIPPSPPTPTPLACRLVTPLVTTLDSPPYLHTRQPRPLSASQGNGTDPHTPLQHSHSLQCS